MSVQLSILWRVCSRFVIGAAFLWLLPTATQADVLHFDEASYEVADGFSIHGVTFHYWQSDVSSTNAHYGTYGPGTLNYVSDPTLVGPASGKLVLQFAQPTPTFEFGVAVSKGGAVDNAVLVRLFDGQDTLISDSALDTFTSDPLGFSEARMTYGQGPAVGRVELTFASGINSFALDNLTYQIPEPTTALLLMLGGFALIAARRTR